MNCLPKVEKIEWYIRMITDNIHGIEPSTQDFKKNHNLIIAKIVTKCYFA